MDSKSVRPLRAAPADHVYQSFAHRSPSRFSVVTAAIALPLTVLLFAWFLVHTLLNLPVLTGGEIAWLVVTLLAASALAYSSSMYLLGSAGALARLRNSRRATRPSPRTRRP